METGANEEKALARYDLVISVVVDELVDRRINVAVGNLVQRADHEVPVRAEIVLHPHFADLRSKIHARERLPVALEESDPGAFSGSRILFEPGSGERSRGRRIGKPAGISVLKQVVVAVIPFDHRIGEWTHVARHRGQLTPELAVGDIAVAIAQQQVRTIAEHLVLAEASAQVECERCRRYLPS